MKNRSGTFRIIIRNGDYDGERWCASDTFTDLHDCISRAVLLSQVLDDGNTDDLYIQEHNGQRWIMLEE